MSLAFAAEASRPSRRPAAPALLADPAASSAAQLSGTAGQLPAPPTMRPIAPLDLPGVVPAPLAAASAPILADMRPGDLLVDERYQRGLSPKSLRLVRSIVEGFDWLKFKPPIVAMTDAGFEVVDGQHSAIAAACHPGITTIPVLVVDESDLERRARAFVSHAVDRLQVKPIQVWHAAVTGGDEDATTIRDVLERAGVTLVSHTPEGRPWAPRETMALAALRKLVDRRGAMRAREVLEIVAAAEVAPISAEHLRAAELLLLDPRYAGVLDGDRITAAIRDLTPKQLAEAKAFAFENRLPGWRALAAVLYRAHAGGRRARPKPAAPEVPAAPAVAPAAPAQARATPDLGTTTIRGGIDVPTKALAAGIAVWRRGGAWPKAWGAPPDHAECGVPGSLLGGVFMLAGTQRWEAVVERAVVLWRRDRTWPATGWGLPPDHPDCAVPERLRRGEAVV